MLEDNSYYFEQSIADFTNDRCVYCQCDKNGDIKRASIILISFLLLSCRLLYMGTYVV